MTFFHGHSQMHVLTYQLDSSCRCLSCIYLDKNVYHMILQGHTIVHHMICIGLL